MPHFLGIWSIITKSYTNDSVGFTRLRAITDSDGKPETKIYDDLITDKEGGVNKPQTTDDKIWHKKL